tara:strand:- start:1006 stop:1254 length:249 start_codon:yes stop_codon:yes gene_type:complete
MTFIEELIIDSSFNLSKHPNPSLWQEGQHAYQIQFECEAFELVKTAAKNAIIEAWRIEYKYSRYQKKIPFQAYTPHQIAGKS